MRFLLFFFPALLFGYPEMVRHGYVNCTTCHVSPNGGGLLTQYGRSLSREVVSTWGTENETKWMYAVQPPEWLNLGGDVRTIQTFIDTPTYRQAKFIWMQVDLEAGVTVGKFDIVGTLGKSDVMEPQTFGDRITSRRHYALWHATDEISVRAGKFYPAFGLLVADHTIATRRGLRFDQGQESYNLELSYLGENFDAFITGIAGRPDQPDLRRDKGFALRSALNLKESYKLGLGYYYGTRDAGSRHLVGPFAIAGFRKDLFALFEFDIVKNNLANGTSTTGLAHYARLNYEFVQGAHVYLTEDVYKSDWSDPSTTANTFGVGLQWFPRPHLEFVAQFQKTKVWAVDPENFNDYFWIQFHFYP